MEDRKPSCCLSCQLWCVNLQTLMPQGKSTAHCNCLYIMHCLIQFCAHQIPEEKATITNTALQCSAAKGPCTCIIYSLLRLPLPSGDATQRWALDSLACHEGNQQAQDYVHDALDDLYDQHYTMDSHNRSGHPKSTISLAICGPSWLSLSMICTASIKAK